MIWSVLSAPKARVQRLGLLALVIASASVAGAQQTDSAGRPQPTADTAIRSRYGTLPARWEFGVGGYLPHINTSVALSSALVGGRDINLDKLGANPNSQSIDLLAGYRFGGAKNLFSLEYFNFTRTGQKTLTDTLIVDDSTRYPIGADVGTRSTISYYGFTYRHYIWRRERWELGAGLGIDVLNLRATLKASGSGVLPSDTVERSGGITAPVPMLGIYGDWELWERIFLRGTFQTLYIANVSGYGGAVRDRRLAAEWYPLDHYGVGFGWHYLGLDLKKYGKNDRYAELRYSIEGISAYVTAAFGAPQPVPHRPAAFRSEPPEGQDFGLVPRNISANLGAYLPSVNTNGQLSSSTNPGSSLDLENTLGFPSSTSSVDLGVAVRTGNKSLVTASYFAFSRSGGKTLADTIHFGDSLYIPGMDIRASGSLAYYGFSYRYYFLRQKKWQLGGGIGLDEVDARTQFGVKATVAGKEDSLQSHGNLSTPAPMLGLYADWEFLPKFYLRGSVQYMQATVSGISATITDDRAAVEWFAFENYGVGLNYHYVGADLTKQIITGSELRLKYTIQGPAIYVTAAW